MASTTPLDILIFASHPDDAELGCAGSICRWIAEGKTVGVVDLTRGELGSRGSAELRDQEAAEAARIMGLSARENLRFRDGFFTYDEAHQRAIIQMIRHYQPKVLIANAPDDRHPDHGKGSRLVRDAAFLAGLAKIQTDWDGNPQLHWRPSRFYFYIQDYNLRPTFVVDISDYYDRKKEVLKAFKSQFYDPTSDQPETYISSQDFWDFVEARARNMGHWVGATFGEGYISETPLKVNDPLDLI